ncbi:hypothetical protein [Martelella alba]|nr:hypothetical protein [Martelella alba]
MSMNDKNSKSAAVNGNTQKNPKTAPGAKPAATNMQPNDKKRK